MTWDGGTGYYVLFDGSVNAGEFNPEFLVIVWESVPFPCDGVIPISGPMLLFNNGSIPAPSNDDTWDLVTGPAYVLIPQSGPLVS